MCLLEIGCSFLAALLWFSQFGIAVDADFESVFKAPATNTSIHSYVPRISHFALTDITKASWVDWLAVKSTQQILGVEKTYIWVQLGDNGWVGDAIWQKIVRSPGVELRTVDIPDTIYQTPIHKNADDVMRLKAIYQYRGEGIGLRVGDQADSGRESILIEASLL